MRQKVVLFIVFALFLFKAYTQEQKGIAFEHELTWEQVREKAKAENKYIFVDCFTTWCGPCKKMDQEVYSFEEVRDYANTHFVCLKVQLDTSKSDNEDVQQWYAQAHTMLKEYKINAFPTYLFFSPEGKIVHRGVGFQITKNFLNTLKQATNPDEQTYTLLDDFHSGKLKFSKMPSLVKILEQTGEYQRANEIADFYIEHYLSKLKESELYTKDNIRFAGSNIRSSKSPIFDIFYHHAAQVDSVTYVGFSNRVVDFLIVKEYITPTLVKWNDDSIVTVKNEDWDQMRNIVQKIFGKEYADRNILKEEIVWYGFKSQWKELIDCNVQLIEKYGLDTAGNNAIYTNNTIYNTIFLHCNDKVVLRKCLKWMKIICDAHPNDGVFLDTYANILYKLGNSKDAISFEQKAYALNADENDLKVNLQKMKEGKPTWN